MRRLVPGVIVAICLSGCAWNPPGALSSADATARSAPPGRSIQRTATPAATRTPPPATPSALPELAATPELVDLRQAGVRQARPGMRLRSEAVDDLIALLEAARLAGFDLEVRSAYRSYVDQAATFERWVDYELTKASQAGAPIKRAVAVERAAGYSAPPGKSEHQSGLTVDLLPRGAPDIGFTLSEPLRAWLAENAHLYGWVQSYPVKLRDGVLITSELTGYTSEPWHWRWQGRAAAAALYEQGYLDPVSPLVPPPLPLICDAEHDPCAPVAGGQPAGR